MKRHILLLCIIFASISTSFSQNTIVQTDKGKIKGYQEDGLLIFKGVPFAAPPVGNLRWRAPEEHQSWINVMTCTQFSASPMQNDPKPFKCWSEEFIAPPKPLNEDCLYLNIWTKASSLEKKKPVLLWIYGGGFVSGSAACAIYDGKYYAEEDVVFVSCNYRLNIFGFLAHPELTLESKGKASGNYAFLDQIQALLWIKKNIEKFGGDPNNVTIMGQSAGSFSVHALIASPLTKGLFQKAIAHSGGLAGSSRGLSLANAEKNGVAITQKIGNKSIDELRKLPAEVLFELLQHSGGGNFGPVLDDYVLPHDLKKLYLDRKFNSVVLLAGWVKGDGDMGNAVTMTVDKFDSELKGRFGDKSMEASKLFPHSTDAESIASAQKLTMLSFAGLPATILGGLNQKPTYLYEFDHVPVAKQDFPDYGAFHTAEIPFALHTLDTWKRPWRKIDLDKEKLISTYWINFIKTSSPNGKDLPKWDSFNQNKMNIMNLGTKDKMVKGQYKKEINFLTMVSGY